MQVNKNMPGSPALSNFEKLTYLFEILKLAYEHIPVSENNKVEQIKVAIGMLDNFPLIAEITFLGDLAAAYFESTSETNQEEDFPVLQFNIILPVTVSSQNFGEIGAIILEINQYIILGGFGISATNEIYYRYNLMLESSGINGAMITDILENISFAVKSYGKSIMDVYNKQLSLVEAINQIRALMLNM